LVVLVSAQTPKQLSQQSRVLQGWLELKMIMVLCTTTAGLYGEVSVIAVRLNFLMPLNFLVTTHTC